MPKPVSRLSNHELGMKRALRWAARAGKAGEVPVGAVLMKDGHIIAGGHNMTRTWHDPTAHAEMVVLHKAVQTLRNERFSGTALYVTLEPCAMCAGAIVQARIPVVVFGAFDPKAGACGSVFKILPSRKLNHRPVVVCGVCKDESANLLRSFFRRRRKAKIRKK